MAAVNTIEVKPTITVTGLPPRPNHVIPKFHNRSNLFPSTFTNKLYEEAQTTAVNRQAWSADPRRRKPVAEQVSLKSPEITGCKIEDKTCNSLKRNKQKRRPISAKARLESVKTISASKTKSPEICKELVPVNGKDVPVVDIGDNAPFPTYHFMFNAKEKYVSDDTKPFLPGVTDNRVPNLDLCHPSILATTSAPEIKPVVYGLNSHQVVFGTDFEEEVHNIKYDLTEPKFTKKEERPLPSTLEPLRSWLTENKSIPGVKDCLIFLPSLENYGDLPEVPPPHSVHEDLPFKEKLPQEQQTTTKKYHHPAFDKKHVEEWVCNHSRPGTVNSRTDHQNYQPFYRSVGEIRTEITELENLMQGLGNLDSDCGMVKFQGEIDRFRKMYKETMKMVPERLLHSPEEQDTFGVKEFLKQHVDIMNEVRRKHTLCLEELRLIEAESGIDSSRKYFKYRTFPPDT